MTPFRFEHTFLGEMTRYWHLFFDETAMREQLEAIGMKAYEIVELKRDADEWRRSVRGTPKRDLPAIVRRITGASLSFTETTVFDVAAGVAKTRVETATLSGRIDLSGEHTLLARGEGSFARVFEGRVGVHLPLVGGRIEKMIAADLEKSYERGAELTQAALSRS